jgi:uncharacterized protein YdeI (YjbR/CyaY-like superfamily)
VVSVPRELATALAAQPQAATAFESLSYSHRKEFAEWVASAKRAETRAARAEKSVAMISAKRHVR